MIKEVNPLGRGVTAEGCLPACFPITNSQADEGERSWLSGVPSSIRAALSSRSGQALVASHWEVSSPSTDIRAFIKWVQTERGLSEVLLKEAFPPQTRCGTSGPFALRSCQGPQSHSGFQNSSPLHREKS